MGIKEEKIKLRTQIKAIINSAQGEAIIQNAHLLQEN